MPLFSNREVIFLRSLILYATENQVPDKHLMYLKTKEKALSLKAFQGHVYEHPKVAFWFLICSLGLSGFPITPTFIGEDVIFHHIHENQFGVALCAALSYIIDGLSIIRIYSRVFMGPHIKITHEVSNRSA